MPTLQTFLYNETCHSITYNEYHLALRKELFPHLLVLTFLPTSVYFSCSYSITAKPYFQSPPKNLTQQIQINPFFFIWLGVLIFNLRFYFFQAGVQEQALSLFQTWNQNCLLVFASKFNQIRDKQYHFIFISLLSQPSYYSLFFSPAFPLCPSHCVSQAS